MTLHTRLVAMFTVLSTVVKRKEENSHGLSLSKVKCPTCCYLRLIISPSVDLKVGNCNVVNACVCVAVCAGLYLQRLAYACIYIYIYIYHLVATDLSHPVRFDALLSPPEPPARIQSICIYIFPNIKLNHRYKSPDKRLR